MRTNNGWKIRYMSLDEKLGIARDYIKSFGEDSGEVGKKYNQSQAGITRIIGSIQDKLSPLEKEMLNQRKGELKNGYRGFSVAKFMAIARVYANTPSAGYADIAELIGESPATVMRIVDRCSKPILTEDEIKKASEKQGRTENEKLLEIARSYINTDLSHKQNAENYGIHEQTSARSTNIAKARGLLTEEEKQKLAEKLAKSPRYGGKKS